MDQREHRCKSCGVVFDDEKENIDKCAKKRLYCELCLAQKNPWSRTEQQIKKRYILITGISAFLVLIVLFAINWGKSKNDNIFEYLIVFGAGYLIIWGIASVLLLPVYMRMKKPHKEQIKNEKEQYIAKMEGKKASRKILLGQEEGEGTKETGE